MTLASRFQSLPCFSKVGNSGRWSVFSSLKRTSTWLYTHWLQFTWFVMLDSTVAMKQGMYKENSW